MNLDALRNLSLADLVGGGDDHLVRAIREAGVALNAAKEQQRHANAALVEAQAVALGGLYGSLDGAGKNDRERSANEAKTLATDPYVLAARRAVAVAQVAVETAELDVETAKKQFELVKARAQVVSALLLSGTDIVLPAVRLPQEAAAAVFTKTPAVTSSVPGAIKSGNGKPFSNKSADHDVPF